MCNVFAASCVLINTKHKYRPLKLPLSCEVVEKGGLPICTGGGISLTPAQISNIHFQIALISEHGGFWMSSVQRARTVADEKRWKIKDRIGHRIF